MNGVEVLLRGPDHWNHASPTDWAEVLATFPLFSAISKRRLRKLVRNATVAEHGPGHIVIQKGTSGDSLYLILGGSAKALGKPASRPLRTGDYIGELSLIDGAPRSATVIATSELHLMTLPRHTFLELMHNAEISLQMLRTLGAQVRRLEARPAQA